MARVGPFDLRLHDPGEPRSVADYRRRARRALPAMVRAYLEGGADDGVTLAANRSAFERWRLCPRLLRSAARRDLRTTVAGTGLELPVALAPTGMTGSFHWNGEVAAARAAERAGTRLVLSTASSYSIEEVAAATGEDHWFQLYPWGDRTVIGELLDRAAAAGYRALFVTADVQVIGNREGERRLGFAVPPTLTPRRIVDAGLRPRWWYGFLRHRRIALANLVTGTGATEALRSVAVHQGLMRPDMSWDDLAWIRERWQGPLFLKGVLRPEDAVAAVEAGATGVVVSNHGGRQLDGAPASIDALPAIVDAVAGRGEVLLDSGVRRGTDVVKALCLGASAVLIGRPFLYGLAADGGRGVSRVLEILAREVDSTMALIGANSVAELDRSYLSDRKDPRCTPG
jgi:isopentenyl diphosphate isomerase/L-lactate dehydrogenase-like FMN-dependent dehydrogenase